MTHSIHRPSRLAASSIRRRISMGWILAADPRAISRRSRGCYPRTRRLILRSPLNCPEFVYATRYVPLALGNKCWPQPCVWPSSVLLRYQLMEGDHWVGALRGRARAVGLSATWHAGLAGVTFGCWRWARWGVRYWRLLSRGYGANAWHCLRCCSACPLWCCTAPAWVPVRVVLALLRLGA